MTREDHLKKVLEQPREYLRKLPSRTFSDIFKDNNQLLSLGYINHTKGKAVLGSLMYMFLSEFLLKYINVSQPLSQEQALLLLDMIIEDYYYLTVDDLKLCFRKVLKGEYGDIYNRVDVPTIYTWIRSYASERASAATFVSDEESKPLIAANSCTYEAYIQSLVKRAESGDIDASQALEQAKNIDRWKRKIQPQAKAYRRQREERMNRQDNNKNKR